jgi:hypothetical protein
MWMQVRGTGEDRLERNEGRKEEQEKEGRN